jgi:Fibronectin type III domain
VFAHGWLTRKALLTTCVLAVALLLPASSPGALARLNTGAAATGTTTSDPNVAYPDAGLNAMFTNYADDSSQGSHWTGGDGTVSVQLPDGRDAWFFSDTFLGTVNSDGSRSWSTPFIHNDIVVQQGAVSSPTLTTLTGTTDGSQTSLVGAPANGYRQVDSAWVDSAANRVYAFYTDYSNPGADGLDGTATATSIATFSLPDLTFQGLTTLPVQAGTLWGSAVLDKSDYTYIYGNGQNSLYVARAPHGEVIASGSNPAADWTYWTGSGWSSNETDAMPVLEGLAGLSITQVGMQYVLAAFDTITAFDANIVAYASATPYGPFGGKTYLYSAPPLNCNCYSYYPQFHQEFAAPGELVLSYNSNSVTTSDSYSDASIYRPTFIDVPWPHTASASAAGPPTGLTATSDGLGVHLSWTAPTTSPTAAYIYAQDMTKGDSYPSRVGMTTGTEATFDNLINGDTYQFTVTSCDGTAESAPSAPVTAVPQVAPPAQAPSNVSATAGHHGTVTVSWSSVPNASWYVVSDQDDTAGATVFSLSGLSTARTSGVVSGLTVGHTYDFEVAAATAGGTGPYSSPATATSYEPPPAPTGLTATANGDGTIDLSWNAIPGCWYFVQTSSDGGQTWSPAINNSAIPTMTNSYQAEYLSVGTTYEFRVSATDSGGAGPASAVVSATER